MKRLVVAAVLMVAVMPTGTLAQAPRNVALSPQHSVGQVVLLKAVHDVSNLYWAEVMVNTSSTASDPGCAITVTTGGWFISTGTQWNGPRTSGVIESQNCSLNIDESGFEVSGSRVTVTYSLTFAARMAGVKRVYLRASSTTSETGFEELGSAAIFNAQGPAGAPGVPGATGPQGPPGPAVRTSAVCASNVPLNIVSSGCRNTPLFFKSVPGGACNVTADTGSCSAVGAASSFGSTAAVCAVCAP